MKFVSFNIQYGFGADGRYDLSRAAKVVAGADIIALQEVERFWERSGFDDQPALLSQMLPDHHFVYGPAYDMDGSFRDGGGRLVNRRRQFGTMILSRLPIVWSRLHLLPMRRVANPLNTQNAAIECMMRTPAGPVRLLSLHLSHIGEDERLDQLDYLLARHRRVPLEGGPWSGTDDEPARGWTHGEPEPEAPLEAIWMGDFNAEPDGVEYRRMVGNTPNRSRAAYHDGFVDAARYAPSSQAASHTHAGEVDGRWIERRLDYCFVGGMLADRIRSVWVDTSEPASDHYPVFVDIDLDAPPRGPDSDLR